MQKWSSKWWKDFGCGLGCSRKGKLTWISKCQRRQIKVRRGVAVSSHLDFIFLPEVFPYADAIQSFRLFLVNSDHCEEKRVSLWTGWVFYLNFPISSFLTTAASHCDEKRVACELVGFSIDHTLGAASHNLRPNWDPGVRLRKYHTIGLGPRIQNIIRLGPRIQNMRKITWTTLLCLHLDCKWNKIWNSKLNEHSTLGISAFREGAFQNMWQK